MNLGDPKQAFRAAAMQTKPRAGVGLVRIEFCVAKSIGIHPMALVAASRPQDCAAEDIRAEQCELAFITQQSRHFNSPAEYFVRTLSQDMGVIAAAFYPSSVNVRFSDFKSNEYAALIGAAAMNRGRCREQPVVGFFGALLGMPP